MRRPRVVRTLLGLALSVVCGWLAFRDVRLRDFTDSITGADVVWLIPAAASLLASFWIRALRWRAMFRGRELDAISPGTAFWTMNIGLFLNSALPARAGEIARAVALKRVTGISLTQGLSATVAERIFDLASLALLMLAALAFLPSSSLARGLAIAACALVAIFLVVLLGRRPLRHVAARALVRLPVIGGARAATTLERIREGAAAFRDLPTGARVAGLSLASWLLLYVCTLFCLRAFATGLPWHAPLLVLVATNIALAAPSTAAGLGVFEAAAVAALAPYSVPAAAAAGFAVTLHVLHIVPSVVLGLIGLARLELALREVSPTRTAGREALSKL
jgi:uncharacterized protein (TIRG00374 family)